jgi:hypothetical protein
VSGQIHGHANVPRRAAVTDKPNARAVLQIYILPRTLETDEKQTVALPLRCRNVPVSQCSGWAGPIGKLALTFRICIRCNAACASM